MPQNDPKPSVTVLYDSAEEQDRKESLEEGKKVPQLVCHEIEAVLTRRGYAVKLLEKRFTGSGSLSLALAGNKSLSKKLFDFHGIKSPDFAIIAPSRVEANPKLTTFPLIVKPINMDASIGISVSASSAIRRRFCRRSNGISPNSHPTSRALPARRRSGSMTSRRRANSLDNRAEFAMAARRAKPELTHPDLIERIVQLAMEHSIRERSAT